MTVKSRLSLAIAAGVLVLTPTAVSSAEADLPSVAIVSMQVQPLIAVSSPGKTLFLTVHYEGVGGVGTQPPLSVAGAPDGTSMQVSALTEQDALVGLALPSTAARGWYALSVRVGGPEPLVEQRVELQIEE